MPLQLGKTEKVVWQVYHVVSAHYEMQGGLLQPLMCREKWKGKALDWHYLIAHDLHAIMIAICMS